MDMTRVDGMNGSARPPPRPPMQSGVYLTPEKTQLLRCREDLVWELAQVQTELDRFEETEEEHDDD